MDHLTQPAVDVHEFVRAVKGSNPFISNRITQADAEAVDVPSIHEREFKRLVKCIDEVRQTGSTAGVLLLGAAGVGKSHLLARLFRWAHEDPGGATVVYLHNVLASPERLPRYLLRATVSCLAGYRPSAYPQSELYAIINRAISRHLDVNHGKGTPSVARRTAILRKIGVELDPEGLVMPVFIAFLEQAVDASRGQTEAEARSKAAVEWLSGETIEPALAEAIGLRRCAEDGACIADDVAVQRTLDVICRLCGKARQPFVLCIDQVDNLDAEKVTALASFLHAALDNGHNLVIVTSGVKESMLNFEQNGTIAQAAWDRLAQFRIELNRISPQEARQIVAERVRRFMVPFQSVERLRALRERAPLLPLGVTVLEGRLGKAIEFRPRDVVSKARECWEEVQERVEELGNEGWLATLSTGDDQGVGKSRRPPRPLVEIIDETVTKKLKEATTERILNPERLPPDADNLATLTASLLKSCEGHQSYTLRTVTRLRSRTAVTYDVVAAEMAPGGKTVKNGLVFVTADNAIKSAWALRRLVEDGHPPAHQILVTDEERRPLRLGAKGQEHLNMLNASGRFRHIRLSLESYSSLDALSAVLGNARVGDLEVEHPVGETRSISETECLDSLHRQGYFLKNPLLHELLTEEAQVIEPKPGDGEPTNDVIRQRIAAELQWRLGMTGMEMTEVLIAREGLKNHVRRSIFQRVREVSEQMHREGHLFAVAQDDDLFLQFRKKVPA